MSELSKNEELILLSIWKLGENAYGATLRESVRRITGKTLNFGSLYNTLYLLVRKGLVRSRESEATAKKGGRRKILYKLTPDGKKALREAYQVQRQAWDGVSAPFLEGKS